MLELPKIGMARSVSKSNVRLDVLTDYIEACVLFGQENELSGSDVVDILCDDEVFENQQLAWRSVDDAWGQMRTRQKVLGLGSAFQVEPKRINRVRDWKDAPAQSFCVLLACQHWYPKWAAQFGKNYTAQGELFERLTHESLTKIFPLWDVHATGWTRSNTQKLKAVVESVAHKLGEAVGEIKKWTKASANEAGLDLMLFRPFADGRTGLPVFLLQCASGADWQDKLRTPDIRVWTKCILFPSDPKRAFATPVAILPDKFSESANKVDGLLLDRLRLLTPTAIDPDWVSTQLKADIVEWMEPRVAVLPLKT